MKAEIIYKDGTRETYENVENIGDTRARITIVIRDNLGGLKCKSFYILNKRKVL